MRKAEDYLKEINSLTLREDLYKIGKQMQEDAIREAVKECANSACVIGGQSNILYMTPLGRVDRYSILSVADKLIKEL